MASPDSGKEGQMSTGISHLLTFCNKGVCKALEVQLCGLKVQLALAGDPAQVNRTTLMSL